MEKVELDKWRKDMQEKINQLRFCWVCGREDIALTEHHSIPRIVKSPKLNLKVLVCENCVKVLHSNDIVLSILKKIHL